MLALLACVAVLGAGLARARRDRPMAAPAAPPVASPAPDAVGLAFPGVDRGRLRTWENGPVRIVSDCAELDGSGLAARLTAVAEWVARDFPGAVAEGARGTLVVFASEDDYRAAMPRIARALGESGRPVPADGYTVGTLACSSWDPAVGSFRPVYAHEFAHAYLASALGLPNHGDWLQEGLATRYQLRLFPQPEVARRTRTAAAHPERWKPLESLANGRTVAPEDYWQAAALVDFLLTPRYGEGFAKLLADVRAGDDTALGPHLADDFGADWPALTDAWVAFLASGAYGDR